MKYYGITDKGLIRKDNQDSYVIASDVAGDIFAIVADGIGGNRGGDIASQLTVAYFSKVFSELRGFQDEKQVIEWINQNITNANDLIFRYGRSHTALKGMGTTFCGALLTSVGRFVVNIGDSRCYAWYSDGRMRQLTNDHTLVNDMLSHGELTMEEAKKFPRKNVLTNALGVWSSVHCDIEPVKEEMAGMLLCSDGLHSYVGRDQIRQILLDADIDPSLRARKLLKSALDAGGYDNVTVILLDFGGDEANEQ